MNTSIQPHSHNGNVGNRKRSLRTSSIVADPSLEEHITCLQKLLLTSSPHSPEYRMATSFLDAFRTVPSPRLVGVELNPGPDGRHKRTKTPMSNGRPPPIPGSSSSSSQRLKKKKQRKRASAGKFTSAMKQYQLSVANPFNFYPPPVQAGSIIPLAKRSLYCKQQISVPTSNANPFWAFFFRPSSVAMCEYGSTLTNTAAFALTVVPALNINSFAATVQTARCISGGGTIDIRYSSDTMPPVISAGSVYDLVPNIRTVTPNAINEISSIQLIDYDGARPGAYATWRPASTTAFDLSSNYGQWSSVGYFENLQVFYVQLTPGKAYNITLRGVYHMETNGGFDAGGGLDDDNVIIEGTMIGSAEDVARTGANVPEQSSGDLSQLVVNVFDSLMAKHASRPSNFSLRTEGGLVGASLVRSPPAHMSTMSDEEEYGTETRIAGRRFTHTLRNM